MRLLPLTALLVLAAVPAAAQEPTARAVVTPVELFPDSTASVELRVDAPRGYSGFLHASAPTDASGAIGALTLPKTYELCRNGRACEDHPLFPGLRLRGYAMTTSGVQSTPGQETSAARAQTLVATVRGVAGLNPSIGGRSQPRRLTTAGGRELRHLEWTGWGSAIARARGRVTATRLADCGGDLYYTRVRTRRGERVPAPTPCGRGARVQAQTR